MSAAQTCPPCTQDCEQGDTCPTRIALQPGMRRCQVKVAGQQAYTGVFRSTYDAQMDAMERFPAAGRIDVQVLP